MGKKKEEHEKEPNHERWLVSYADFITLLFAVFVTLYAMSFTDKQKVDEVIKSMNASFGIGTSETMDIINNQSFSPVPGLVDVSKPQVVPPLTQPEEDPKIKKKKAQEAEKKSEEEAAKKAKKTTAPEPSTVADQVKKTHADEQEFIKIKEQILMLIKEKGAGGQVALTIDSRGLVISLKDSEFFESGQATVRRGATPLLNNIVSAIDKYTNAIRIEGHTDNIPIQTAAFPSNWELSTGRATNIVQYMISNHAFSPDKLSAIGYGEYRPIADNSTPAGRQKNRRVDVVLLSEKGEQGEPTAGLRTE
jgi:chemotaxis protein MotB